MSNIDPIFDKLNKNIAVYLYNDLEECVVRLSPTVNSFRTFVKFKGEEPYEIANSESIGVDARISGKIITKKEFENY